MSARLWEVGQKNKTAIVWFNPLQKLSQILNWFFLWISPVLLNYLVPTYMYWSLTSIVFFFVQYCSFRFHFPSWITKLHCALNQETCAITLTTKINSFQKSFTRSSPIRACLVNLWGKRCGWRSLFAFYFYLSLLWVSICFRPNSLKTVYFLSKL